MKRQSPHWKGTLIKCALFSCRLTDISELSDHILVHSKCGPMGWTPQLEHLMKSQCIHSFWNAITQYIISWVGFYLKTWQSNIWHAKGATSRFAHPSVTLGAKQGCKKAYVRNLTCTNLCAIYNTVAFIAIIIIAKDTKEIRWQKHSTNQRFIAQWGNNVCQGRSKTAIYNYWYIKGSVLISMYSIRNVSSPTSP